jgi:predicted CopG family antitoxin
MATKTITLELDAYERLRRAKRKPKESFSSVVRRARWDESIEAREVLGRLKELQSARPEGFPQDEALDGVEARALRRGRRTRPDLEAAGQ